MANIKEIILTENELPKIYNWINKTASDSKTFTSKCDLKELILPAEFEDGVLWNKNTYRIVAIEKGLFKDCSKLKTVTIPDTVRDIGESAFENCSALENINIPNGIKNIARATFKGCTSLKSIIIPKGVTKIGDDAFKGIEHVHYDGKATGAPWGAKEFTTTEMLEEEAKK